MKRAITKYFRGEWLNETVPISKRLTFRVIYLAKSDYVENSKLVKASWTELLYILKNELAIQKLQYAKVLWRIQRQPDSKFRLQFVCISESALQAYQGQFVLLYPETWLAKQCLQAEQLYLVGSTEQYWAYVAADGNAYFTDKKGLMNRSEHFLSAIGALDEKSITTAKTVNIKQITAEQVQLPKWYSWLGMLHYQAKPKSVSIKGWQPYLIFTAVAVLVYGTILSVGLALYHDHLKTQVAQRQQAAEVVLQQRQQTDKIVEQINAYSPLITAAPKYSAMLMFLAEQLPEGTELRRSQLSENMAVIQGVAPSATDVLAKLGKSPLISDARFDRPVQADKNAESFTISFVFNPTEVQGAEH